MHPVPSAAFTDPPLSFVHDVAAVCAASVTLSPLATQPAIAAGWLARLLVAVWVGALPLGRHAPAGLRLTCGGVLALFSLPMASLPSAAGLGTEAIASVAPACLIASEAIVGLGLGLVAACIVGSAAWAGAVVGSVSGLSWADDFTLDGGEDTAGVARLAWWCGVAAFFATGGHLAVIGGLLDTARSLPVGGLAHGITMDSLVAPATAAPGLGLALAAAVATPILAAVVAFHAAASLALRTVGFAPGAGLLQGAAALIVVAALIIGGDAWLGGFAGTATEMLQRSLPAADR